MTTSNLQIYDQDYRHFDILIWQVPTWASAIFTFTMTTAGLVLANAKNIEASLGLDPLKTLTTFLLTVFIVLVLLANVLVRFRLHQGALPSPSSIPRPFWQPRGHTSLQLIIFIEAAVLLTFAAHTAGVPHWISNAIGTLFLLGGFSVLELWVLRTIRLLRSLPSQRVG